MCKSKKKEGATQNQSREVVARDGRVGEKGEIDKRAQTFSCKMEDERQSQ